MNFIFLFQLLTVFLCSIYSTSSPVYSNFIVLFQGSQGSSFLIEILSQFKSVCVVGYEPLSNTGKQTEDILHKLLHIENHVSFRQYREAIAPYVDSWEHIDKCSGSERVFGLKARLDGTHLKKIIQSHRFKDTKFIILERNIFKQSVATYRRKYCGLGQFALRIKVEKNESQDEIRKFKEHKCFVKPQILRDLAMYYFRKHGSNIELSKKYPSKFLVVSYEDMTSNVSEVLKTRVGPFLSIDITERAERPTSLQKASPHMLCDSIENFEEVCNMVKDTMQPNFLELYNADKCVEAPKKPHCCSQC